MDIYGKNETMIPTLLGNIREIETLGRGGTVLMNWKKIPIHATFSWGEMIWMFMEDNDTHCHSIQKRDI